jgi:hypothetical protein
VANDLPIRTRLLDSLRIAALIGTIACAGEPSLRIETTALPASPAGYAFREPSVAADPNHPDDVVVTAAAYDSVRSATHALGQTPWHFNPVWMSANGGRSWSEGQNVVASARREESQAYWWGDAWIAMGVDGRAITSFAYAYADSDTKRNRGLGLAWQAERGTPFANFTTVPAPGGPLHVTNVVVDRWETSAYRGRTYATASVEAWDSSGASGGGTLVITHSDTTVSHFTVPKEIPGTRAVRALVSARMAIRPDGRLFVFYSQPSLAAVQYVTSSDGGATFATPQTLYMGPPSRGPGDSFCKTHPTVTTCTGTWELHWPQVAVGETGKNRGVLLATWMESHLEGDRPRAEVFVSTSKDGEQWSRPAKLDGSLQPSEVLDFASPAVTEDGLWVLAYRADSARTQVVLYRSTDEGKSWQRVAVLAERRFSSRRVMTGLGADGGEFQPGDYVGLAAAGSRLYAAFMFPVDDDYKGPGRIFVSRIETH